VGSALNKRLQEESSDLIILPATRKEADLFSYNETKKLIDDFKPNLIINAAAKVGGILSNNENRMEFILENLKINMNILESVKENNKIKIVNLGSSCIYPLGVENPINETALMSGKLEPTNSPYAMAKLAAIEMGDAMNKQFGHTIINLMPTNLYGPNDNFSENDSHVIPGLIARMQNSKTKGDKTFNVWGTGKPLREFLHSYDLADAIWFIVKNDIEEKLINIGSGSEISIKDLVKIIQKTIGFNGDIKFDITKPDGNPRKLLDSSKIFEHGWKPKINLKDGLESTYDWYLNNYIIKK